jgi:hypothetical protein
MKIIIDSNAFFDDPNLGSPEIRLLLEYVSKGLGSVVVPQVVLDEVVNTFGERLQKHSREMVTSVDKLNWLTDGNASAKLPTIDVPKEQQSYQKRLRSVLNSLNAEILPYPKVPHGELAARDIGRRKPFSEAGRGYRDALIWCAVLEHLAAQTDGDLVLVTANHSDFCQRDDHKALHIHLQDDLRKAGFKGSIVVRPKIHDVVEEFAKPKLKRLDRITRKLQDSTYKGIKLQKLLASQFNAILEGINRCLNLEFAGIDLEQPFGVDGLYDAGDAEIVDVIELDGGDIYIELNVEYEANIYAYVFKSDAYGLDDNSPVHVSDWNWNESYAEVSGTVTLDVSIELTVNPTKRPKLIGLEVVSARNQENEREY